MYPAGFNASFTLRRRIDVSDIEKTTYIVKRDGIWYTDDIAIVVRSQMDDMTREYKGTC